MSGIAVVWGPEHESIVYYEVWRLRRILRRNKLDRDDAMQEGRMVLMHKLDKPFNLQRIIVRRGLCSWLRKAAKWSRVLRRHTMPTVSLDAPLHADQKERRVTFLDLLPAPVDTQPDVWLQQRFDALPPREREVLVRRQAGETLAEIGVHFSVSRARIQQLEARALERLAEGAV